MHKYSGDQDLNIGTPVANRSHSSMESIIGMFVNTVVIRLKFDKDMSFRKLLRMTNEAILDAIAHQDLSFDKIVEIVNPGRMADINPVFQVAFAWDENLNVPLRLNGIKSNKVFMHGGVSPFDITCSMLDSGEKIEGEIEYNIDLIKSDTIINLCDNYVNLVSNLVSDYETPISSVSLISGEESLKPPSQSKVDNKIKVSGLRVKNGKTAHPRVNTILTPTEGKIYQIWCDVLKMKNIFPDDNFFEIGGNSLLAISVISKIKSQYNADLELRVLFDNPRITDFSAVIDSSGYELPEIKSGEKKEEIKSGMINGSINEAKNMMMINPHGTRTSLIIIYCGNFSYSLSNYFGPDQPVYGFFDDGWLTGTKRIHSKVETIAKEYIRQLKKVLSDGPYIIGGHSFGGLIAYEMAVQLQKSGDRIPFLVLFDTMSPYAIKSFYQRINLTHLYKSIFKPVAKKMWQFLKLAVFNTFFFIGKHLPKRLRSYYIVTNYLIQLYKYRPEKFNGEILLFQIKQEYSAYKNYYGWDSLSEKVENIALEGDHMSMMTDKKYGEIIGKEIEKYMAK